MTPKGGSNHPELSRLGRTAPGVGVRQRAIPGAVPSPFPGRPVTTPRDVTAPWSRPARSASRGVATDKPPFTHGRQKAMEGLSIFPTTS
jgi:hypothetical protein